MKIKTALFSLILVICSIILALYVIGALHANNEGRLISPANGTFASNVTVIFNCTAGTNTSLGVQNMTLWLAKSGTSMAFNKTNASALGAMDGNKNFSATFAQFNLTEGVWYWNCRSYNGSSAAEEAGVTNNIVNVSRVDNELVIDASLAKVNFNSSTPANDTYYNVYQNPSLKIAVDISELWMANLSYKVWMANSTGYVLNYTTSSDGATTYNLTLISLEVLFNSSFNASKLVFEVNVTDKANNRNASERRTVTFEPAPVLSIAWPFNGTLFKANATSVEIRFNLSYYDPRMNTTGTVYRLGLGTGLSNNSFAHNTTITLSLNATNQAGRNQLLSFIARNNISFETRNYTSVDIDLAPAIVLNKPDNSLWTTVTTQLLNFTAINNDTNVSTLHSCELWGNMVGHNASFLMNQSVNAYNGSSSTNYIFNGSTVSNFTVTLLEGNYTWGVWCNDTTGNSVYSANRTLYIDTSNPVPSITATESRGYATIAIGSTVNLGCTATDTVDDTPSTTIDSITKPSGAVTNSPGSSFSNVDQTGTYTIQCTATDAAGRTASTTATFVAQYTTLGGQSGAGGGGGGGVTVTTQKVSVPEIRPDSPGIIKLSDAANYAVRQLEVNVLNAVTNVKFTVSKLAGKPADATSEAAASADKVYKYIEVKKENLDDTNVKDAVVSFQVQKSWIVDKGHKNNVVLKRLRGSTWEMLSTSITDEDDSYVYYKASSIGLSYFAIAMEEKPAAAVTEEKPAEAAPETKPAVEELAPAKKPSKKWLWWSVAALVFAGLVAAVLLLRKKRR